MKRPPFETFKGATCKGSMVLGSACGTCEKCQWEREQLAPTPAPEPAEQMARASVCSHMKIAPVIIFKAIDEVDRHGWHCQDCGIEFAPKPATPTQTAAGSHDTVKSIAATIRTHHHSAYETCKACDDLPILLNRLAAASQPAERGVISNALGNHTFSGAERQVSARDWLDAQRIEQVYHSVYGNGPYNPLAEVKRITTAELLEAFHHQAGSGSLRDVLLAHWPLVECDHANKRDRANCSCGLVDLGWHPSVGDAVKSWIEHVLPLPTPPKATEKQEGQ